MTSWVASSRPFASENKNAAQESWQESRSSTESIALKPRIAIPVPTTADLGYNDRSWPQYAAAVAAAGGEPVRIELGSDVRGWKLTVAATDGVLLPGSPADIDRAGYGAERDPETAPPDPAREALDRLLLEDAARLGKPVLGICFGLQSINVWRGGSLVQDLMPVPVNHAAGSAVAVAHSFLVAPDSLLGSLVDPAEAMAEGDFLRLPINTSHHQAVASPGEGLRIVARCPEDAVIEALELESALEMSNIRKPFLLGVQWHPERSVGISATSRNLFKALVDRCLSDVPRGTV